MARAKSEGNPMTVKIPIELEHYKGDEYVRAVVYGDSAVFAEGRTPEEAKANLGPEIEYSTSSEVSQEERARHLEHIVNPPDEVNITHVEAEIDGETVTVK